MGSLLLPVSIPTPPKLPHSSQVPAVSVSEKFAAARLRVLFPLRARRHRLQLSSSDPGIPEEECSETLVQELMVPDDWLIPSNALQHMQSLLARQRHLRAAVAVIHPKEDVRRRRSLSSCFAGGGEHRSHGDRVLHLKSSGVTPLQGDFYDHESLVKATKQVDVVISTVGHAQLADQTKIIAAIKEAGNVKESEWLRVALHKWLDDEYCPEAANVEISMVAARSYYESLIAKQADVGEILLKMASDLEDLSFQESFHGPFSSANAAIRLITERMERTGWS